MKSLVLFLALILICNSYSIWTTKKRTNSKKNKIDPERKNVKSVNDLSPFKLIRTVKAQHTLEEIMRNNLHKSEVDLEPNRYHILSKAEHPTDMPEKGEKYYPGLPKIKSYDYNENANEAIKRRRHSYQLDKKPYYGGSNDDVEIKWDATDGLMKTPIEYKDLDLFTDTESRLAKLQDDFKKLNSTTWPPNLEYNFDEDYPNYRSKTYKKDPKGSLYYNPLEPERNKTLEEMLKEIEYIKTELMTSTKVNAQAGEPIQYAKFPEMDKQYQNGRNSHLEIQNKEIAEKYHYDAAERIKNMTMTMDEKLAIQKDFEKNNIADLDAIKKEEIEESKKKIANMEAIKKHVEDESKEAEEVKEDTTSQKNDSQPKNITSSEGVDEEEVTAGERVKTRQPQNKKKLNVKAKMQEKDKNVRVKLGSQKKEEKKNLKKH